MLDTNASLTALALREDGLPFSWSASGGGHDLFGATLLMSLLAITPNLPILMEPWFVVQDRESSAPMEGIFSMRDPKKDEEEIFARKVN